MTNTDLSKEREEFVRNFLRRGVEFAEELLSENDALRAELAGLREENGRLRAHLAREDAIRDLLLSVEQLEHERKQLLERSNELQASRRRNEERYLQIEAELHDLANLYVASFQLHASLGASRVLGHLADVINQLIGAEQFVIYLLTEDGKQAVPVESIGVTAELLEPIAVGQGPVGDACLTGLSKMREEAPLKQGSLESPLAVVPLIVEGKAIGAVAVVGLLEQKEAWASVDRELFHLVGAHAGTALVAANLYNGIESPLQATKGLYETLKK